MAYNPISGFVVQVITQAGQIASDYYLKFYEANTTTPLSMSTDSSGSSLLVKAKIGDSGYPISNPLDNSTIFVPHVDQDYRLVIYTNETDADDNNTAASFVNVPFLSPIVSTDSLQEYVDDTFGTAAYIDKQTDTDDFTTNRAMLTDGTTDSATRGNYMTVSGTVDDIVLTSQYAKPVTSLGEGMQFRFKATGTNTGPVTIAIDGLTAVDGETVTGVACPAGYIRDDVETVIAVNSSGDFTIDRMIERGSNADGEYVLNSDGTLDFYIYSTADGTTSSSQAYDIPYEPSDVNYTTALSCNGKTGEVNTNELEFMSSCITRNFSSTQVYLYGFTPNAGNSTTIPIAIFGSGKWYS